MYAVPSMEFFCSHLISCFPDMLLGYFLNDFEMVPAASIIAGITSVFIFHMPFISAVRYLYFRNFTTSFLITFLSPEIAISNNIHVHFILSQIMISGLLLGMVLYYYYYYYYYYSLALLHNISAGSQNSTVSLTKHLFIHCPDKTFLTIRHVLSIIAFRIRRAGIEKF